MGKINVLVLSAIGEECLRQIAGVSPRINLRDASDLWDAPDMVTAERKGDFRDDKFEALLAQAEVLYGYRPPQNVIARAPGLKWIQTMLAGVDHILTDDILQSPVILTNMRGIHASPVSELALEMMLMLAKQAPLCFQSKQEKRWQRFVPDLLCFRTVGILGLGSIGKEVARLAKALRMRVLAVDETRGVRPAKNVDTMIPAGQLQQLLAESDFVVLVLPLTPRTDKLIGERELKAMKPTAYLINVGRGRTVDEEALVRALEEGWIAGAGLDAYTTEPLSSDSKLWELANVFISPHVAGRMNNYAVVANEIFCENLRRYVGRKRLRNVVNKKKGY